MIQKDPNSITKEEFFPIKFQENTICYIHSFSLQQNLKEKMEIMSPKKQIEEKIWQLFIYGHYMLVWKNEEPSLYDFMD